MATVGDEVSPSSSSVTLGVDRYFFFFMGEMIGIEMGLGVFIVAFSDEMFSSLLPTSSDEFQFRHKRIQNLLRNPILLRFLATKFKFCH